MSATSARRRLRPRAGASVRAPAPPPATPTIRWVAFAALAALGGALAPAAVPRIGYVTDVEGNLAYFERYVAASGVLRFDAGGALAFVDDGCRFVYGGDVVDKGPGDLRLCKLLCDLRDRYPDRVALLVGNRDLNKLRLSSEVGPRALADVAAAAVARPHWDDAAPRYAAWLSARADSRAARLRWALAHTLGCPDTFEFRRAELAALRGRAADDDAVVDSMVGSVLPGGALRAYLERAAVAARLGDTLFVHGAVDALTAGFVPDAAAAFGVGAEGDAAFPPTRTFFGDRDVDAWVRDLNALLAAGLADHAARPHFDANGARGGECLMALQNRCALWGRSVVSNCYADGGNVDSRTAAARRAATWARVRAVEARGGPHDARAFEAGTKYTSDARDARVHAWLRASGVTRVVVGHRPVGDVPAILRAPPGGVEVVMADTSYADRAAPDGRGATVAAVAVEAVAGGTRTVARGVRADGAAYVAAMPVLGGAGAAAADDGVRPRLGTCDADGWWCKARVGDRSLLSRGDGRHVETKLVDSTSVT